MLWLHQGVRAERRSLTAWCVKTRYKPPRGSFSQAPDYNAPLGSSQHTNMFSPHFPLVLGEIRIPTAAAQSSLKEAQAVRSTKMALAVVCPKMKAPRVTMNTP